MIVFEKPHALTDAPLHYCPGCTHGIIHRLVAEAIDALGIEGNTIGIAPVGVDRTEHGVHGNETAIAAHHPAAVVRHPAASAGLYPEH